MDKPRWVSATASPDDLPNASDALKEPNGLLAVGGCLHPEWLLTAYVRGIFPWYESRQPILWWSPDPRAVLYPRELHVSRRLRRKIKNSPLRVTVDVDFEAVIDACAAPRQYTEETWITPHMRSAYIELHNLGWAHSFEAWADDALVGGFYGVSIGAVFFGESMFSRQTDASKIAFIHGVAFLEARGCELIDCQVWSHHLQSLGARTIPRAEFLELLDKLCDPPGTPCSWRTTTDIAM
jgi:leucyl/phenylalanyl-tRNA--protein transferase